MFSLANNPIPLSGAVPYTFRPQSGMLEAMNPAPWARIQP